MDHHPTPAELEGFVLGNISAERTRAVIEHLVQGCGVCSGWLAPHLPYLFDREAGNLVEASQPSEAAVYDMALDRAFAAAREAGQFLPPLRTPEQKKREVLDLLAGGGLEALLEAPSHLDGLPTCEALLERSWALRHDDPPQMVQLARLAVLQADRPWGQTLTAQEAMDLRCRAWTELGNARRVNDDLDGAQDALNRATELFLLGTQDELLGARFFDVLASQFAARRSLNLACATLDVVVAVYQRHDDEHLAGRALVMKGMFTGYEGNAEEAIRLIRRGLATVDEARDPGLVVSALQSQAWFLVDCGRPSEARRAVWDLRKRRPGLSGRINELKLRWLEGHIYMGLDDLDHAELALQQVREGFEEEGLPYKAALAGLELGAVRLRQDRPAQAAQGVLDATGVFLTFGIEREALAAVLLLREAAERQALTLSLLDQAIRYLRRAEQDPNARFELSITA